MKKQIQHGILAACMVYMFSANSGHAMIWRVNAGSNFNNSTLWGSNYGGTAAFPVFKEVNQAINWGTFNDGDTVHVEGSVYVYPQTDIDRKVVLIGPGYYLNDNPKTSNDGQSAQIVRINFNTGSAGSTVMGMNVMVYGNSAHGYIQVYADSITIKRCRIERSVYFPVGILLQRVVITQNYFPEGFSNNALLQNNSAYVPPVDLYFNNNICKKTLVWYWGNGTLANITECRNNIFDGPDNLASPNLEFDTDDFSNNILMPVNAIVNIPAAPGEVHHNIGSLSSQFGTAYNNLVEANIPILFTAGPSPDGYYQVASGSQAYQSGSDGTDRGVYGGPVLSRYTLSCLAPVPVVYEVVSTGIAVPVPGLTVTVKARTIK